MRRRTWSAAVLLTGVLLTGAGCAPIWLLGGAAAGTGTWAYLHGELRGVQDAELSAVYSAAERTIKGLDFVIAAQSKDAFQAVIDGEGSQDRTVRIKLHREDAAHTEIRVRVGVFGNEQESQVILNRIRGELGR